jgi:glycosyltransferase involved in cell wall biosynthesis
MILSQFSGPSEPVDQPHQLADAFIANGHSVKVVVIPWQRSEKDVISYSEHDRLDVLRVPPLQISRFGKTMGLAMRWTLSSFFAVRHAKKFLGNERVDLIYSTSPCASVAFLLRWALRKFKAVSYLYIVDFFPHHQRAIGLLPGGPVLKLAALQENALIRMFDVVGCMTRKNVEYLKRNYRLRPEQRIEILPLSTGISPKVEVDRAAVRARYGLANDKVIAVFGGQITEGRGIDQILEAARISREAEPNLHWLLIGSGRLVHLVQAYIDDGGDNLTLVSNLPRDTYLELASACDLGLVVTVPIADIPTFPSKTLDYLQVGLPVVAAVETDTDYREFVEEHGFGLVVEAGSPRDLLHAVSALEHDPEMRTTMGVGGQRVLKTVLNVEQTAGQISKALGLRRQIDAL